MLTMPYQVLRIELVAYCLFFLALISANERVGNISSNGEYVDETGVSDNDDEDSFYWKLWFDFAKLKNIDVENGKEAYTALNDTHDVFFVCEYILHNLYRVDLSRGKLRRIVVIPVQ